MARLTQLTLAEARALLQPLDVQLSGIEALDAGSVNSNFACEVEGQRRYFLRIYEEQGPAGARAEQRLLSELHSAGVPVAAARGQDGVAWLGMHRNKPVALFPWVAGETLCQGLVEPSHAHRVGQALARLHLAPVSALPAGRFEVQDLYARLAQVEAQSASLAPDARATRTRLEAATQARHAELPRGVIHGDLFRDNVLWARGEISALLDFESASQGPFVYDLAVCVHAWCYGYAFDAGLVRALGSGYRSERPLSAVETQAFSAEAAAAALRFVVTRMTDYSLRAQPGQAPTRDYRRFLERYSAAQSGELARMLGI